jgi:flagellar biosynthesis/type III secretory pathway protein FliH
MNLQAPMKINYEALFNSHSAAARYRKSAADESQDESAMNEVFTGPQVEEILNAERERLKKKWDEERVQLEEAALRKGREEGFEKASGEYRGSITTITEALGAAESGLQRMLEEIKPHIASVAFDLAEKILEVPVESEEIRDRVSEAVETIIDQLSAHTEVVIHVSDSDYGRVCTMLEEKESDHIQLKAASELNPGEYRIDTPNEQIARDFKHTLENFRETFSLIL